MQRPNDLRLWKRWMKADACAVLALALLACGGEPVVLAAAVSAQGDAPPIPEVGLSEASRAYLTIETVQPRERPAELSVPGRVEFRPQARAAIGTPVSARVRTVLVKPGELVERGAPLVELDSAEAAAIRAVLEQASMAAAVAEENLRRQEELTRRGVGLELEEFEAKIAARQARAELARARRSAELIGDGSDGMVTLRAPAQGVILSVDVELGAAVQPGEASLIRLGDATKLWIVAEVSESGASAVRAGQPVQIRPSGAGKSPLVLSGTVEAVGSKLDPVSRRLPFYVALRSDASALKSGMLVEVSLASGAGGELLLPPTAVLIKEGSRRIAYVERDDGSFEARELRTGPSRDASVVILDGIRPGERVVTKGALLLDRAAGQLL